MSTSETATFELCKCPCGKGRIVKHITTQDNPWSSADIVYEIQCRACSAAWRLDYRRLVLKKSEIQYKNAQLAEKSEHKKLRTIVDELVNQYFTAFAAPSKKAELAEMERLDITTQSYSSFLKGKREGYKPSELCYGLRNPKWLKKLASNQGVEKKLSRLISSMSKAKKTSKIAYDQIVQKKIV